MSVTPSSTGLLNTGPAPTILSCFHCCHLGRQAVTSATYLRFASSASMSLSPCHTRLIALDIYQTCNITSQPASYMLTPGPMRLTTWPRTVFPKKKVLNFCKVHPQLVCKAHRAEVAHLYQRLPALPMSAHSQLHGGMFADQ